MRPIELNCLDHYRFLPIFCHLILLFRHAGVRRFSSAFAFSDHFALRLIDATITLPEAVQSYSGSRASNTFLASLFVRHDPAARPDLICVTRNRSRSKVNGSHATRYGVIASPFLTSTGFTGWPFGCLPQLRITFISISLQSLS